METRVLEIRRGAQGAMEASLSSEDPYLRDYGYEVLSHDPAAIDLSRAKEGLPLLLHHDLTQPVGMLRGVHIRDKKLRANVKFFDTEAGRNAEAMVNDGYRNMSIGYSIHKKTRTGTEDGHPVYRIDRWMPHEASLVTVPADVTVGIGRSTTLKETVMTAETTTPEVRTEAKPERGTIRRDDMRDILAMGEMFAQQGGEKLAARALQDGATVEQFRNQLMKHVASKPLPFESIGASRSTSGYSLTNIVRAAVDPAQFGHLAGFEREMSQESERRYGTRSQGVFVPDSVLFKRDWATTLNGGSSVIADALRPDLLAEIDRPRSRVIEAGARVLTGLTGNLRIPRQTAGVSVDWQAEQGTAGETNVNFDNLDLSPKRLTAYINVSRQQILQGSVDVEHLLQSDLMRAADYMIDMAAINGSGASNQPRGIRNTSGIGSVAGGTNGAALAWGHVVDLEAAVAQNNVSFDRPGYLINAPTRAWLRKTQRGTDLDFILPGLKADEPLNSYPLWVSNNVPSNLVKGTSGAKCSSVIFSGDWSELIIARFGDAEIVIDPYTLAKTATVVITLNLFVDIGVRKPQAFATMEDALTT